MGLFRKSAFGIDISDASIKAIELKQKNGGVKVLAYTSFPLQKGLIKNGIVKDSDALGVEIKRGLRPNGKNIFSTEACVFSIPEIQAFLDIIEIGGNQSSFNEAVTSHVQNRFPFNPEKLVFDWDIVAETDDSTDILVVAAQKKVIDGYTAAIKYAGFQPVLAEPQSLSNARSVFDFTKCEELKPTLVVDFGAQSSSLFIYDECSIRLSTLLHFSGQDITQEIIDTIGGTFNKAESMKKKFGLSLGVKGKSKKRVLQKIMDDVIIYLKKVIKQYETKTDRKVDSVVLAGKTSQLPYLEEYLKKKMETRIQIATPSKSIINSKELAKHVKKDSSTTVCGLAMRSFNPRFNEEINILKK